MDTETLSKVASIFDLGKVITWDKTSGGSVNHTFAVDTDKGRFVLQRLSPMFTQKSVVNGLCVHVWLASRGFLTPKYLVDPQGGLTVRLGENDFLWRASEYIEHTAKPEKTPARVVSAAYNLGLFHSYMKGYPFELSDPLPHFHDSPFILQKMKKVVLGNMESSLGARLLDLLPEYYLPAGLTQNIIHGDPKFDNFLFKEDEVAALIDLDTVMIGSELLDLGDAFRSWCRKPDNTFDHQLFEAGYASYRQASGCQHSSKTVLRAVALITLELACRYLTDAHEESYFVLLEGYDSLYEQNIALSKRCLGYYDSLVRFL